MSLKRKIRNAEWLRASWYSNSKAKKMVTVKQMKFMDSLGIRYHEYMTAQEALFLISNRVGR